MALPTGTIEEMRVRQAYLHRRIKDLGRQRIDEVIAIRDSHERYRAAEALKQSWGYPGRGHGLDLEDVDRLDAAFQYLSQSPIAALDKLVEQQAASSPPLGRAPVKANLVRTIKARRRSSVPWMPLRPRPRWDGGLASSTDVAAFLKRVEEWVESEWQALVFPSETFSSSFEALRDVRDYAGNLEHILHFTEMHAGVGPAVEVPVDEPILDVVAGIVVRAIQERHKNNFLLGKKARNFIEALDWWKREFMFAYQVEGPVRAALHMAGSPSLPIGELREYDPDIPLHHSWTGERRAAVTGAYERMAVARGTIELLEGEIARVGRPGLLRCDPTDAQAVAEEVTQRRENDDARLGGLWCHRVALLSVAAFLVPITPFALFMLLSGRRQIGDVSWIIGEAGASVPVVAASGTIVLELCLLWRRRTSAKANRRRLKQLLVIQACLGVSLLTAVLFLPVFALSAGQTLPERHADGSLNWRRAGGTLLYVRTLSLLPEQAVSESGSIYTRELVARRGPLSGRRFLVTEEQYDLLRAGKPLDP